MPKRKKQKKTKKTTKKADKVEKGEQTEQWRKYYDKRREEINARRRERYKNNPKVRERIQTRMRQYSREIARKRNDSQVVRNSLVWRWGELGMDKDEIERRLKILGRPLLPIMVNFGGVLRPLYPISTAAAEIGFFTRTIRHWERQGVVPPATFRDDRQRRWYSQEYIDLLLEGIGIVKQEPRWKPTRLREELEALWDRNFGGWNNEQKHLSKRGKKGKKG